MFCKNCGNQLNNGDSNCSNCGAEVVSNSVEQTPKKKKGIIKK